MSAAAPIIAAKSTEKAAKTAAGAEQQGIEFQRESRDLSLGYQKPYRDAGYNALSALMDMSGLSRASSGGSDGTPGNQPGVRSKSARYLPDKPREFQGSDSQWETFYREYQKDPGSFVNSDGKYFDSPASIIGETEDPSSGLYGRSGKTWGNIMGSLQSSSAGAEDVFNTLQSDVPSMGAYGAYDWQTNNPGYAFRLEEGQKATENLLRSAGMLNSGKALRSITRYGQDYASNEYDKAWARLSSIAGLGGSSVSSGNASIGNAAGAIQQGYSNIGQATAAGQIGKANVWGGAINDTVSAVGMFYGMGGGAGSSGAGGSLGIPRG